MRLRRVVISGFKTFARRSEVRLEPGITAIVGPNGSGKSNLVDAIRWALGETNARELRGARMDEVIYSGGNGRGRMGFAEVELVMDNEDGRLAVEDVEVAVSRRVVRHGDSEFRLNGDRVRLRDIERVLGTTGLTQSGYAVVAQNDIDAIIEASPAQRRALVEQAAGVRSLRAATEDALARVGQAELTLHRFEDLLGETEPRLAALAEQASLALEQRELTDRLGHLRGSLAREAWRAARAQLRQATRRAEAAAVRLEAAAAAEAAFAGRLEQHRQRLDELRRGNREAALRLEQARLAVERATGERRRGRDRVAAGVLARAGAAVALRSARAEWQLRRDELATLNAEAGEGGASAATVESRVAAVRTEYQERAREQAEAEAALGAVEASLRGLEEERLEADAAVRRSTTQLRLFSEATQALEQRVAEAAGAVDALETEVAAAQAAQLRTSDRERATAAAREASAAELATARQVAAEALAQLDAARQAARVALARAASLRGQVEGALGGRGAIAEAVAAGDISARRLVDSFTVIDPSDGAAIEAALEPHLGAWITADIDAARRLLDAGSAREELMRPDVAAPTSAACPAGARAAVNALRAEPQAAAALAHCLAGTWLVADLQAAERVVAATGATAVTPDGIVVTSTGLRGGGRPGRTLQLAAQEHDAAAAAEAAITREHTAEAGRAAAAQRVAELEAADQAANDDLQVLRLEATERAAAVAAATSRLELERRRLTSARAELEARERERGELHGAEGHAGNALADSEQRLAAARAAAVGVRDAVESARAHVLQAADRLRLEETEAARLLAALAEGDRRRRAATEAVSAAEARCSDASLAILAAELEVLAALAQQRVARQAVGAAQAVIDSAEASLAATVPGLAESERAVAALEAERAEVAVVLARAEDEGVAARAEATAAAERVAELAEAVRGDEEDEGPEPEAGDAERAEREIIRLERRVAAMGPVNALAPEQHRELAERVAVLRSGRDDLAGACQDIRAMAARLTSAIDSRFEAVFGAVSVHFHELFAELFPGGRATLRREEPARPAGEDAGDVPAGARPAGVEILAQPPGKRLQPLSLFSGGERALTALAVILALQQVNPSPFYVFDEVDAPLDDSNVLRFTRLLTRLAAEQQFIVVTHNHITMAAADALHGVTSDSDGVSSVISVRFDADSGETVPEGNVVGLRQSTIRAAV